MADADLLKGVKEIAEFIGESEDATWRLLKSKKLPAFQYGRKAPWRMRKSAYRLMLAKLEQECAV